jgi:hypothetical protein
VGGCFSNKFILGADYVDKTHLATQGSQTFKDPWLS